MTLRKWLLPVLMILVATSALAVTAVVDVAPDTVQAVSYWGYVAASPALIVAFVICGWLIPRKG